MDEREILLILDLINDGDNWKAIDKLSHYLMRPNITMTEELIIVNLTNIAESANIKEYSGYHNNVVDTQKGKRVYRGNLN